MSDPREHLKKARQQEILEAFQDSNEPVLTTGEVSDRIESVTQETVLTYLKSMRGERLSGKKTKQGWIWWVPTQESGSSNEKALTELSETTIGLVILSLVSVQDIEGEYSNCSGWGYICTPGGRPVLESPESRSC